MLLIWALLALTAIDLDTQLLPDNITLPLLWVGLLFNLFGVFTDLYSAVLGAVMSYLALWSVYWLFKLVTGKGHGLWRFQAARGTGHWLGWQLLPLIILLSSLVGATVGIILIVALRHNRNIPIPFGPYGGRRADCPVLGANPDRKIPATALRFINPFDMSQDRLIIGLTGGIGSGKSTVAALFRGTWRGHHRYGRHCPPTHASRWRGHCGDPCRLRQRLPHG